MACLSKYFFSLSIIPDTPPKTFFKNVYCVITGFIWANTFHRITRNIVIFPRVDLIFQTWNFMNLIPKAFYLRHIVKCTKEEQWVHIEDAHAHPHNIFMCLFLKNKAGPNTPRQSWRGNNKMFSPSGDWKVWHGSSNPTAATSRASWLVSSLPGMATARPPTARHYRRYEVVQTAQYITEQTPEQLIK